MIRVASFFQNAGSSAPGWVKCLTAISALFTFYCMFNQNLRNSVFGECYKLRFVKRTGSPASVRTAAIAFLGWSGAFLSLFSSTFWDWSYSGVLYVGVGLAVMLSSYVDALAFRRGNWR